MNKQYFISNDTEIDLNEHAVTANIGSAIFRVTDNATLTLDGNGFITNRGQTGYVVNGGTVIVKSGRYTSTKAEPFRAEAGGTVIINGGELIGQEGAIDTNGGHGTVVINGGELIGLDNFALASNGSSGRGGNKFTINGGTLEGNIQSSGYEAIGVYVANNDTFVMNGGKIIAHGGTGICMRAGDVTINNGEIIATNVDANGNIVADGKIGDDPTIMTGCSAIIFHETSNYPGQQEGEMKLTINGGTITGVDHSVQVLSEKAEPNVTVKGGYLAPAYPEV